jgi:hypothetical protein
MTKKTLVLISVAVILGAVYVINFTSLFQKAEIKILPQIRPPRAKVMEMISSVLHLHE